MNAKIRQNRKLRARRKTTLGRRKNVSKSILEGKPFDIETHSPEELASIRRQVLNGVQNDSWKAIRRTAILCLIVLPLLWQSWKLVSYWHFF